MLANGGLHPGLLLPVTGQRVEKSADALEDAEAAPRVCLPLSTSQHRASGPGWQDDGSWSGASSLVIRPGGVLRWQKGACNIIGPSLALSPWATLLVSRSSGGSGSGSSRAASAGLGMLAACRALLHRAPHTRPVETMRSSWWTLSLLSSSPPTPILIVKPSLHQRASRARPAPGRATTAAPPSRADPL
jgi:hypothetical protein